MQSIAALLLIDDENNLRQVLARVLELEGYHVWQARTAREGCELLESHSDEVEVVLSDVKLPDDNGLNILRKVKEKYPLPEVILMTAYGTIQDGVNAMKLGAFDYITKGDNDEQLLVTVARAADKARLRKRVAELEKQVEPKNTLDTIIGHTPALKQAKELTARVAVTDATVLLEGETGVGKELFAQAIHSTSPRRSKPFVAVNCSAFPKDLLESEIFGYKKGAFTGAIADKKGLFEEANGGTMFLDEIGEMPPELQAKFLRVLETQTFTKLGDTKPVRINVRLVAATNRDLKAEAEAGHFRYDLYYRLSVFKIRVPTLRERQADIPLLAHHFLQLYNVKMNRRLQGMSEEFMQKLKSYPWKGNIRELKNVIERAVILADEDTLTPEHMPAEFWTAAPSPEAAESDTSLSTIERNHILRILEQCGGNKTEAARRLHIGLTTLYRKLQEYGLS
ncbi:sigma-54 dependent transcriptional regulator [Pontibacter sp. SGAir0037]|uniref:sigma-54-dependent transcriptional regulator n=1 Tax=Pontibacter sp. SGAir0037 TaxID=2571030 RepID=UPI0010CD4710|nr:sigma-54 dependent transcriptional regulator [Pontibacter sp. SGAir0037]QCR21802.1 sigma-54-dependent Fis family transcriptional regulator [Pontibacter sp. SGAir0037]